MKFSTMFPQRNSLVLAAALTCSLGLIASLTGCAIGGSNDLGKIVATPTVSGISGKVHGGLQPVVGALVQLYEVGAGGYGTPAKPILTATVTTTSTGGFNITNDYTCDSGSYVYITASGGNPGSGTNNNLALMAALGSCSALKANAATTFIYMNEVTTVAAAYALAQFSGGTTFGTTLKAQPGANGVTAPADNFATSSTNVQGVANAMAVAQVLANNTTGTSPGTNLNGTAQVENYTVNTIADILSTCVNSTGGSAGDSTNCGKLFTGTTPTGGTAPADTIQAALQLALHPGDANLLAGTPSGSTLDSLITAQPPYQPYINTTIAGNTIPDWTIAVSYVPTSSGTPLLSQTSGVAIDGFGNAWVTNIGNKSVVELTPNGDPIQAGSTAGTYAVNSYNVGGTATAVTGGSTASNAFFGIAIDPSNNAFASDFSGANLFRITASGASFGTSGEVTTNKNGGGGTAAASFSTGSSAAHPVGIAIDGSSNVYTTLYSGGTAPAGGTGCGTYTSGSKNLITFPYNSGSASYGSLIYGSSAGSNQTFIAIDNTTNDTAGGTAIPGAPFAWWIAESSGGTETHPSGGTSGHYEFLYQANTTTTGANPQGCNTALNSISSSAASSAPTTKINQNNASTNATDVLNNSYSVAFDSNNNLWAANQLPTDTNGTLTTSFTKITPAYGAAVSSANFQAATSFVSYTAGGMLSSGFKPFALAIDGSGNAYASNISTKPVIAAVTNSGVGLAPSSTGFTGATYSPDGTSYGLARPISTAGNIAIDLSGNLWVTSGAATTATTTTPIIASVPATNVVQIVGLATPVVTPLSIAVKNSQLGTRP